MASVYRSQKTAKRLKKCSYHDYSYCNIKGITIITIMIIALFCLSSVSHTFALSTESNSGFGKCYNLVLYLYIYILYILFDLKLSSLKEYVFYKIKILSKNSSKAFLASEYFLIRLFVVGSFQNFCYETTKHTDVSFSVVKQRNICVT